MTWKKAYHANCWGPLGGNAVGVTSITQLTYRTFGDMERAIREIGEAEFTGVELFDGNLLDYEVDCKKFTAVLVSSAEKLVAAYSGGDFIIDDILSEELARIQRAANIAAALGAEHLVVGDGAKRADGIKPDDIKTLGAALEKVVAMGKARGLRAHYHPHLTTIVEGPNEVHEVFKETSIDFCPDTANLAAGGGDVPAMTREDRARISNVHLKGWRKDPFAFTPIDEGTLDVGAIVQALKDIAYEGWVTIELDSWPITKDGAHRSMQFLRDAESQASTL